MNEILFNAVGRLNPLTYNSDGKIVANVVESVNKIMSRNFIEFPSGSYHLQRPTSDYLSKCSLENFNIYLCRHVIMYLLIAIKKYEAQFS